MACIIACTPGFHSTDLKLQKRGVATMPILVAKRQQSSVKRFQVTGTFLIAQQLMSYSTSLIPQCNWWWLLDLTTPFPMSRHHLSLLIDRSNSRLSDPAPLKGNYSRHAQTQKTSVHNVAHLVNMSTTKFHYSILKTGGVIQGNVSHTNLCKFRSDCCFFLVYC